MCVFNGKMAIIWETVRDTAKATINH